MMGNVEGLAHGVEFGYVIVRNLITVLQHDAHLEDELAKLVDTIIDMVEGAVIEVVNDGGEGLGDRVYVQILDA